MFHLSRIILVVLLCCNIAHSKKDKKKKDILTKDLPFIACEVCEKAVNELYIQTEVLRNDAPYHKLEEIMVVDTIDALCKEDEKAGQWIRELDIAETRKKDKSYLTLTKPGGVSKCESECDTIAKSCSDLFEEELDRDDLSALLWKGSKNSASIQKTVCEKWTKRCPNKKFFSDKHKRVDYPFTAMKPKDLEMEQLMAKMKGAGMGGMSMYNKDDMEEMMANGGYGGGAGGDMYGDGDPYEDFDPSAMGGGGSGGYPPNDEDDPSQSSSDFEF